uniref:Secreted protein n=1 Tax=Oryza rufipogon TaxID=4529 RepID=A0A0E0NN63_ORYRU
MRESSAGSLVILLQRVQALMSSAVSSRSRMLRRTSLGRVENQSNQCEGREERGYLHCGDLSCSSPFDTRLINIDLTCCTSVGGCCLDTGNTSPLYLFYLV